jgi:hypothetical protein
MAPQPETKNSDLADEVFLRAMTFPEEERANWTTSPWRGEFRWFRSPNVIALEKWRQIHGKGG